MRRWFRIASRPICRHCGETVTLSSLLTSGAFRGGEWFCGDCLEWIQKRKEWAVRRLKSVSSRVDSCVVTGA
jgi:hypothetical protein